MKVVLTPDEINICHIIGRMRSLISRSARVTDQKFGPQGGIEGDIQGMLAEYAFAKYFNTFPDLGLSPRAGGADGKLKGYNYDIKSTKYKNGKLVTKINANPDVDIYVLCIVDEPIVTIMGYAPKSELLDSENIQDLGRGKCYCLDQEKLIQFK